MTAVERLRDTLRLLRRRDPGMVHAVSIDAEQEDLVLFDMGRGAHSHVDFEPRDLDDKAPDVLAGEALAALAAQRAERRLAGKSAPAQKPATERLHLADRPLVWSPLNMSFEVGRAAGRPVLASLTAARQVLIVGASGGERDEEYLAMLEDMAWEVWALNLIPPTDRHGRVRADVWWDLHQRKAQTADDLRWIAACPRPIYVPPDLYDAGPHCVAYPLEAARELGGGAPPFACTFAYQIALAILHGYAEIALYGVELSLGTRREATVEWASVNWWLGFAAARGVRVRVPKDSRLGRHQRLYGLEYDEEVADVEAYLARTEPWLREQLEELDRKRVSGDATPGTARPSVGG